MCVCMCVCACSVAQSYPLFVTSWTEFLQIPLSIAVPRQEYWGGLPCPPPGDLPNPGIEPRSPALRAERSLSEPPGQPKNIRVGSLSLLQGINPGIKPSSLVSPALASGFFTPSATCYGEFKRMMKRHPLLTSKGKKALLPSSRLAKGLDGSWAGFQVPISPPVRV